MLFGPLGPLTSTSAAPGHSGPPSSAQASARADDLRPRRDDVLTDRPGSRITPMITGVQMSPRPEQPDPTPGPPAAPTPPLTRVGLVVHGGRAEAAGARDQVYAWCAAHDPSSMSTG